MEAALEERETCETCGEAHIGGRHHESAGDGAIEADASPELAADEGDKAAPAEVLAFTVSYRNHPFPVALPASEPMATLLAGIEEATTIPAAGQKLILKGRSLLPRGADPASLTLAAAAITQGARVVLVGTPAAQLASLADQEARLARTLAARARITSRPGARPFRRSAAPVTTRDLAEAEHGFLRVEALPGFPDRDAARDVLDRLRRDPAVTRIMRSRRWTVGALIELSPSERTILGYNRNRGEVVALRLRTDALDGFRAYRDVRRVLLHELAHMRHSEHDAQFHALNRELGREVDEHERAEGRGRTLAELGPVHRYDPVEEEHTDGGGFEGGAFVLGGAAPPPTASPRDLAALGALARARAARERGERDEDGGPGKGPGGQGGVAEGEGGGR